MMKKYLLLLPAFLMAALFASCFKDDDDEEKVSEQWKKQNAEYIATLEADGDYTKVVPVWANGTFVLMKWHNNPTTTQNALQPLDNSTCNVKYALRLVDGTKVDDSYSQTTYGDSIYRTKPNQNIVGMQVALTNMHEGDSVTLVVPYTAGYGTYKHKSIPAYSTLIFDVKLKKIVAYEVPSAQ